MADWAREAMQDWARERGLAFEEHGLLAPTNHVLHAGMGLGPHRAGLVTQYGSRGLTSVGGFTKRDERFTLNICRGTLPGGAEGVLAHHVYLVKGLGTETSSWSAVPHTVVLVHVPDAVRVLRDVRSRAAAGWLVEPEDDAGTVGRVMDGRVSEALGRLGHDVDVDLHDGWLCLSVDQTWQDAQRLDGLCLAAAAIADNLNRAAAAQPALDHDRALPPPRDGEQARWIDEGVRTLDWPKPPESVGAARAAYADAGRGASRARGRKAGGIALVALLVMTLLFAAIDLVALLFGVPLAAIAVFMFFEVVLFLPWTVRAALRAGREFGADDLAHRSGQFGLEAFAREYARSRGLTLEDRDELRYRLPPPLPGAPLRSWHGRLGDLDGPYGRLVMWIDRTELGTTRYALVAVAEGVLLVEPVADEERSAARLDALAARARDQALQAGGMLQGLPQH